MSAGSITLEERVTKLESQFRAPHLVRMIPVAEAASRLRGEVIREPLEHEKYRDRSLVVVCPTRGMIADDVVEAWNHIAWPQNQKRNGPMFARGFEVAAAYNALIANILAHPVLKTWKYVMTLEDDNIPLFDAPLRLLETIEEGGWDGVSGLYFTKDAIHEPMAYGDAEEYRRTKKSHYYPIDLSKIEPCAKEPCEDRTCKKHVVECLGIPMGCAIWKMDLFREIEPPWYQTVEDKILADGRLVRVEEADRLVTANPEGDFKKLLTQDLFACHRWVLKGKRFAVDSRVRVGHLDVNTGMVH